MLNSEKEKNFSRSQARLDGNLAKALIWLGEDKFRWCKVSILNGPNEFGQYNVQRVRDGWYATTDRIVNLTTEEKKALLDASGN
jgi:hypothetical protein